MRGCSMGGLLAEFNEHCLTATCEVTKLNQLTKSTPYVDLGR